MSLIMTVILDPAKLQMNWASASGTNALREFTTKASYFVTIIGMGDVPDAPEPEKERKISIRAWRTEAFSDAVFAIAITLLVLEIGVPEDSERSLFRDILDQWPAYLAYLVSFATIGAIWSAHVVITEYLGRVTTTLTRLNLLLLMTVAFLPYPTELLAYYIDHETDERVAVTFYGGCLVACALLISVIWRYAVGAGLVRGDAAKEDIRTLTGRLTPSLAGYVAMIGLGLFFPILAVLGYLVLAVIIMVPFRELRGRAG
jgi:uncharacterized membrane protein